MTRPILPFALLGLALSVQANTLYKCEGPDGRTTYTNQKGNQKCEIIAQDKPVSTISAPPKKPRQATPADFPRVSGEQQKARDDDRRAILEQELANEQKNLDAARQALAEQGNAKLPDERLKPHRDRLQLHERNVESIRREIANLK